MGRLKGEGVGLEMGDRSNGSQDRGEVVQKRGRKAEQVVAGVRPKPLALVSATLHLPKINLRY